MFNLRLLMCRLDNLHLRMKPETGGGNQGVAARMLRNSNRMGRPAWICRPIGVGAWAPPSLRGQQWIRGKNRPASAGR